MAVMASSFVVVGSAIEGFVVVGFVVVGFVVVVIDLCVYLVKVALTGFVVVPSRK